MMRIKPTKSPPKVHQKITLNIRQNNIMILFDISSTFHMVTHRLSKEFYKGEKLDLKEYRKEFFLGLLWVLDRHIKMFKDYGDPVICIDEKSHPSWRKEMYPMYKSARKKLRDGQAKFDYSDAFKLFDDFLNACIDHSCIKSIGVPRAEADDIILIVAEHLASLGNNVMVLSPDKDFIQLQVDPKIKQYSWFTKKIISVEDKGSMEEWLNEHICLGDATDAVPRIVDFQQFLPGVEKFLESKNYTGSPYEFSKSFYDLDEFDKFGGVFVKEPFGPAKLKKMIDVHGSVENFVDSNPIIKENYERNKKLVLTEGIPDDIRESILKEFKKPVKCDVPSFADALGLEISELPDFLQDKHLGNSSFMDLW